MSEEARKKLAHGDYLGATPAHETRSDDDHEFILMCDGYDSRRALRADSSKHGQKAAAQQEAQTPDMESFFSAAPSVEEKQSTALINDVFLSPIPQADGSILPAGRMIITSTDPNFIYDEFTRRALLFINVEVTERIARHEVPYRAGQPQEIELTVSDFMKRTKIKSRTAAREYFILTMERLTSMRFEVVGRDGQTYFYSLASEGLKNPRRGRYCIVLTGSFMHHMLHPGNPKISPTHIILELDIHHNPGSFDLAYELHSWAHQYEDREDMRRRINIEKLIRRLPSWRDPATIKTDSERSRLLIRPLKDRLDYLVSMGVLKWWDFVPHGEYPEYPDTHVWINSLENLKTDTITNRKGKAQKVRRQVVYPSYNDVKSWDLVFEFAHYDEAWAEDWIAHNEEKRLPDSN